MFKFLLKFLGFQKKSDRNNLENRLNEEISKSTNDFINRPIYTTMTDEVIDSTPDDELIYTIYCGIACKFPADYKKEFETVLGLSESRRSFYLIWQLEAEVNNGGFNQFYANSSGQFAELTPDALKLFGAFKFADLMNRANDTYLNKLDQIIEHQDGTLEGFSRSYKDSPLNNFDTEFYELYNTENLLKLQVDFVRLNKQDFIDN